MASKLNILMILSDQERGRPDLPAALELPGHERLYAKGTSFDNYYVTTAPCTPSRSVIYSGLHTQATGIIGNSNAPPFSELPHEVSVGHKLRNAGYYTAYKGKWHISEMSAPSPYDATVLEPYGFADYGPDSDSAGAAWEGYMRDRAIASSASNWLQTTGSALAADGKPWFLAVNFHNPHDIMWYLASERQQVNRKTPARPSELRAAPTASPYDVQWDDNLPKSFSDDLSKKPWAHDNHRKIWEVLLGGPEMDDLEGWRNHYSYYMNCLRDVDQQLSLLLDGLEASGQADNTIIVYTADHGEMGGAHGLREKGPMLYKENLRVPLIISHPDAAGSRTTDSLASAVDLVPTLLRFAGYSDDDIADQFPELVGIDLASALAGKEETSIRDERGILVYFGVVLWAYGAEAALAFIEKMASAPPGTPRPAPAKDRLAQPIDDRAMLRGIHTGRYKFGRYFAPAEHHVPDDWKTLTAHNDLELYDLEVDPDEMNNLAANPESHRETILELNDRLNALIKLEVGDDDGRELPGPAEQYQLAKG